MLPRSLAGRLVLASLMALLPAACAAVVVMAASLFLASGYLLRAELEHEVAQVGAGLRPSSDGGVAMSLPLQVANLYDAMPADAAYRVVSRDGRVVASSRPGHALDTLAGRRPHGQRVPSWQEGADDIVLEVAEAPVQVGSQEYWVQVAHSRRLVSTLHDHAGELYLKAGGITAILALLTFAVSTYLTTRRLVRPMNEVSRVASGIGPRNLGTRLHSRDLPRELEPLIDAFNATLARLQNGYRVQQDFLASAAHELKTPLALLQAEIELGAANREVLLRDTAVMARQVHQLLHLAEASEGQNYSFAPLRLRPVLADAADYLQRLASRHGVCIVLDDQADDGAAVEADSSAVFVLAKNLLENAVHHAPPGSVVRVELGAGCFAVRDEGPGVAMADRPHLFERFWRGRTGGNGAGLGLAICREICVAHGWSIGLDQDSRPGARFVVCFDTPP